MRQLRATPKIKKRPPYEFILDELAGLDLTTRRMFGCTAVYVGPKIMFVMYKPESKRINGGEEFSTRSTSLTSNKHQYHSASDSFHSAESSASGATSDHKTPGVLDQDIGIWVCIPKEYTRVMKAEFPQLKGVSFFPDENSAWQCLPESHPDFEELALRFCKMIQKGDPRIGRLPKPKPKPKSKSKTKLPKKTVAQRSLKKKPEGKTPPARKKSR